MRIHASIGRLLDLVGKHPKTSAMAALALGVIDVALVVRAAVHAKAGSDTAKSIGIGLIEALNDPGKTVFHAILLPIAILAFLPGFPGSHLHEIRPKLSSTIFCVLVGLVIVSVASSVQHYTPSADGRQFLRSPADCPNPHIAKELFRIRRDMRELETSNESVKRNLHDRYRDRDAEEPCQESSVRASWSGALTAVGLTFAALLIWEVLLHVAATIAASRKRYQSILVTASILSFWIPLHVYSDSYLNFGLQDIQSFVGLTLIAFSAAALVITLTWLLELKDVLASKIAVTILVGFSAAVAAVAKIKQEELNNAISVISKVSWPELLVTYLLIGTTLAAASYILLTRKTK